MATTEANVTPLERELIVYEKGIPELLEVDTALLQMLDKTDSDPVSNRATRIPLLEKIQGTYQQTGMDGADMGATSGPVWQVATLTPYYLSFGVSYTSLARFATEGQKGVKNAVNETFSLAMRQFKSAIDMHLNTAGDGVLGTITSVATNDLTLTTDGFKEELFYVGMPVQVFNAALSTDRGSTTVTAINRVTHVVSVAAAPGGTTATDKLVVEGLAATVTAQSSIFGVPYHQSDAATGTWLGLNRANFPGVRTPSINASSSNLTTTFIRQALNNIRMHVGDEYLRDPASKLVAYTHPCQADQYEALAQLISQIIKQPSSNQAVDLLFGHASDMSMGGVPIRQSIHADRTRIDFLCLGMWGRVQGTDTGYHKVGGQFIFPKYRSGGDGLHSEEFFYLKTGLQLYNRNPLSGAYIKSLTVPSGIY